MVIVLRRVFWLALVAGAGCAGYVLWQRRVGDGDTTAAPEWPPLPTDGATGDTTAIGWVEPTDGACPVTHPIKANAKSGIYHRPGGRFYDRTVPERCYADEHSAVADGYRASKS